MNNYSMGDISDPGTLLVREDAVAFYLGGRTPHIWTAMQVHAQTARFRHPIWVWGDKAGHDGGIVEAHAILTALAQLGVPHGTAVTVDMETKADPDYLHAADQVLVAAGYRLSVYGSKSTIEGNPLTSGGRWVAEWTGKPHFTGIAGEWACQWQKDRAPGNEEFPWDISLVNSVTQLWDTQHVEVQEGVLVRLPSGASRVVRSVNGGASWS